MNLKRAGLSLLLSVTVAAPVWADNPVHQLVIRDHRFEPAELHVPADQRVKLVIDNQDATAEEFESHDLKREKIIPGHKKATVWVGPLAKGEYHFVGEFHEETAKGTLIAE